MRLRELMPMAQARVDSEWQRTQWLSYMIHAWSMARKDLLPLDQFDPRVKKPTAGSESAGPKNKPYTKGEWDAIVNAMTQEAPIGQRKSSYRVVRQDGTLVREVDHG